MKSKDTPDQEIKLKLQLELLWWLFTAILVAAVLAPIYLKGLDYPFYGMNILFIVLFVTVTRYAFLLKHTWLAQLRWIKIVIVFSSVIFTFLLVMNLFEFHNYIDEVGFQNMVAHIEVDKQFSTIRYIKRQMILFGVGSILGLIAFALRMIVSLWRMRHSKSRV